MDKEAIQVSARYAAIEAQHFDGGYFSEAVRAQGEKFRSLNEQDQQAFFTDTFNTVYAAAKSVKAHPRFGRGEIDLTDQGLGTITVVTSEYTAEQVAEWDDEDARPYKSLLVFVDSFNPTTEKQEQWINHPDDPLGLSTMGPTMVVVDDEPDYFGEPVHAELNGNFYAGYNEFNINDETMRLLDAKETLDIIVEVLSK